MRSGRFIAGAAACLAVGAIGCGEDPNAGVPTGMPVDPDTPIVAVGPPMTGLHVVGNHIENADGLTVILHGVNRSGTEYQCVHGTGQIFDGPSDLESVRAMSTW